MALSCKIRFGLLGYVLDLAQSDPNEENLSSHNLRGLNLEAETVPLCRTANSIAVILSKFTSKVHRSHRNAEAVRFSTNQRYKFKVFNASGGAPRRQLGSTSEDLNFKLAVEMGKLAV